MKQNSRSKFEHRLNNLFETEISGSDDSISGDLSLQSDWAKYLCVLVSGYLEQGIKEIMIEYASKCASPNISRYIDRSWPNSKNMKFEAIKDILEKCDENWSIKFEEWIKENDTRKDHLNSLVKWRNEISHGNDTNTNGVTRNTVKERWETAKKIVKKVEEIVLN